MINQLTKSKQNTKKQGNLPKLASKQSIGINHNYNIHSIKLNKLCHTNNSGELKHSHSPITQRETEKERKLRMYENLTLNRVKLDRPYLNKLSDLLQSKKDPEYPFKRLHIKEMQYINNDLVLPKSLQRIKGLLLRESSLMRNSANEEKEFKALPIKCKLKKSPSIENGMKKILLQYNALDYDDPTLLLYSSEQDSKVLYDQLSTKVNISPRSHNLTRNNSSLVSNRKSPNSPVKEKNDAVEKLYKLMCKYTTKISLLKNIRKKKKADGKHMLSCIDLFSYDSQRWNQNKKIIEIKKEKHNKIRESTEKALRKYALSNDKLNTLLIN